MQLCRLKIIKNSRNLLDISKKSVKCLNFWLITPNYPNIHPTHGMLKKDVYYMTVSIERLTRRVPGGSQKRNKNKCEMSQVWGHLCGWLLFFLCWIFLDCRRREFCFKSFSLLSVLAINQLVLAWHPMAKALKQLFLRSGVPSCLWLGFS